MSAAIEATKEEEKPQPKGQGGIIRKLRLDMIRRMDDAKLVDPNRWISKRQPTPMDQLSGTYLNRQLAFNGDSSLAFFSGAPLHEDPEEE